MQAGVKRRRLLGNVWTGRWAADGLSGSWSDGKGHVLAFELHDAVHPLAEWAAKLGTSYAGSINTAYAISFEVLQKAPDGLAGLYRYDARPGKLASKGRIASTAGDVEMAEVDEHGNVTGTWRGKILPNHLDGVWVNPGNQKAAPFEPCEPSRGTCSWRARKDSFRSRRSRST